MDEDEAKTIASAWVRKLEANILSKVQHDNNARKHRHQHESSVTNEFRDDKLLQSYSPLKSTEKIHSDSTKISPTSSLFDLKGNDKPNSNLTRLEQNSSRETQTQSTRTSARTPRVDLEIVRQRRLQHFENNRDHALRDNQKGENRSDSQETFATENHRSKMLQCEANPCERQDENSSHFMENSWIYNSYDCGFDTQRSDDDDKLRLELWGLRGAVESGQLDIHSYIRPVRSSAVRQNIQNESFAHKYRQSTSNPVSIRWSSSQDELSKSSSFRDDNYNITSIDNNGHLQVDISGEENLDVLTSMLTIESPQGEGERPSYARAMHKSMNEAPPWVGEGPNDVDSAHFNSSKYPSASFDDVITQNESEDTYQPKEDFTRFTVSKHQSCKQLGGPIPQISGKLYNGFETSDSESSVNAVSAKSNKPLKSPKGKQKILSELTEYLDAGRSSKKSRDKCLDSHEKFRKDPSSGKKVRDFQKSNSSKISFSEEIDFDNSFVEKLCKSSSPVAVHQNGFRSASISPENHEYIPKSPQIAYNCQDDNIFSPDSSFSLNMPCAEDEPRFGNLEKQAHDHHFAVLAKSCPACQEINSKAANWCIECGSALIAVKPTMLNQEQSQVYEEERKRTKKLLDNALDYQSNSSSSLTSLSKVERDLNQDIINLSKEVDKNSGFSNESLQSNLSSYKRRWQKSSIAWSSYEPQELSKPSSMNKSKSNKNSEKKELQKSKDRLMDPALRSRSSSNLTAVENGKRKSKLKNGSKLRQRSTSETYHDDCDAGSLSINLELTNKKSPRGSKSTNHGRPRSAKPSKEKKSNRNRPSSTRPHSQSPSQLSDEVSFSSKKAVNGSVDIPQLNLDDVGSYDRILTLIRSQRDDEPVPYLYLPDEILLEIFSNLSNQDLVSCASVCSQFYRIAMDESLWKTIVIRKKRNICDEWLESIGDRHPSSLTISQCSGNNVSSEGLRRLFRKCSESLEEADFSGCSGGDLIGESILLHISVRCFNVVSVDVSWTNVSDNGVQELAKNLKRIECLCLNGCQAVTDRSLTAVAKQHGESLRIFEVFGCFNLTPAGLLLFGSQCSHLQTLNIGQCHKMTDSAVGNLVSHLPEIENLDLRGCKQTRDSAVKKIIRNCPHLKSLVLANCPLITDATLTEISTNLADIQSLDICGCSYITDAGVRALARSCHKLELLDLSSTGNAVTSKSIVALSSYCSQSLRVLKLSFCSDISVHTVNQVVKNCKKLTLLHLYGCKRIKEVDKIKNINPNLVIEK